MFNETMKGTLKNLNQAGIRYSQIAKMLQCDRSHISRYANGQGNMSLPKEARLIEVIREIKEAVKNA